MAAEIKNNRVPVAIESLDENTSGTYLLGDTKVVYLNFFRQNGVGMVSVKELYDLYSDPKGKVPKALRPFDIARIYRFLKTDFSEGGCTNEYKVEEVMNPGKYGAHKALAVIRTLQVPGGTIKIEEKRFRLDKALNGEYTCPAWLLGCMFYTLAEDPCEEEECVINLEYLKKIEITPIPERRPRGERPSRRRTPRPPRRPNHEFWAEHGEPIKETEVEMAD